MIKELFAQPYDKSDLPVSIPNIGRDSLPLLFNELGFKVGAEIGVDAGLFSEKICKGNPDLKLFAVDPWIDYEGYRTGRVTQKQMDEWYDTAKNRLAPYNCELVREFSMDALKRFEDNSLDFVYIDANHDLRHAVEDIIEWSKKVKPGGIISGHDYIVIERGSDVVHVKYAVDVITKAFKIKPWFALGRKEKIPGEIRENSRSWMWFKK